MPVSKSIIGHLWIPIQSAQVQALSQETACVSQAGRYPLLKSFHKSAPNQILRRCFGFASQADGTFPLIVQFLERKSAFFDIIL